MKKELIEAAERAFNLPAGKCWWGYDYVTPFGQYLFVNDLVTGSDIGSCEDGEYSVWLLLLAAEVAE